MRANNLFYAIAAFAGIMLAGCAKNEPAPGESDISISLDRQSLILPAGSSSALEVSVSPEMAAPTLAWSSESPDIASVDDYGVVTGVSEGETTVVVSTEDGTSRAECKVSVVADMETFIKLQLRQAMTEMNVQEDALKNLGWLMDDPLEQWENLYVEPAAENEIGYWVAVWMYDVLEGELSPALFSIPGLLGVDFSDNNLTGAIPSYIAKAKYLEYLYLDGNNLTGQIPAEICSLALLETIDLSDNNLTGEIPAWTSNPEKLEDADFSGNRLTGPVPEVLRANDNFYDFVFNPQQEGYGIDEDTGIEDTDKNTLVAIAQAWGDSAPESIAESWTAGNRIQDFYGVTCDGFGRITGLDLSGLGIGTVPEELGNLSNLRFLGLAKNGLTSLPAELGKLFMLEELNLSWNQFSEVPDIFDGLSKMKYLDFSKNTLTEVPDIFGNMPCLETLQFYDNKLKSVPSGLGGLAHLKYLDLGVNEITSVPDDFCDLPSLAWLSLDYNKLKSVPEGIRSMPKLEYLSLFENEIEGEIPSWLCDLTELADLALSNNNLVGEIPEDIGNISGLVKLSLYGNNLTGGLKPGLFTLVKLEDLDLSHNQLSGNIPSEVGNLTKLYYLNLTDNLITGSIPAELGNLPDLKMCYLIDNNLSGHVPESVLNHPYFSDWMISPQNDGYYFDNYPPSSGSMTNAR